MRLLKFENEARYVQGNGGGREDVSMHPELLCDYDIMVWRREKNWSRGTDASEYGIELARVNEYDPPTRDLNKRDKCFTKIRNLIQRTFV